MVEKSGTATDKLAAATENPPVPTDKSQRRPIKPAETDKLAAPVEKSGTATDKLAAGTENPPVPTDRIPALTDKTSCDR